MCSGFGRRYFGIFPLSQCGTAETASCLRSFVATWLLMKLVLSVDGVVINGSMQEASTINERKGYR